MLASLAGQAQPSSEQQLKAAYLVNFLKYIEWPENPTQATICLFGRDVMSAVLYTYEGRLIAGRVLATMAATSSSGALSFVRYPAAPARRSRTAYWSSG